MLFLALAVGLLFGAGARSAVAQDDDEYYGTLTVINDDDEEVAGATLELFDADGESVGTETCPPGGHFALPSGRFHIRVTAAGYDAADTGWFRVPMHEDSETWEAGVVLKRAVPETVRWTLRVVDQDGDPLPGATIQFPDGRRRRGVDASGALIVDLPPGKHVVTVERVGFVASQGVEFYVETGEGERTTVLPLQRKELFDGTLSVFNEDEEQVAGATLEFFVAENEPAIGKGECPPGGAFPLPPRRFHIRVTAAGYDVADTGWFEVPMNADSETWEAGVTLKRAAPQAVRWTLRVEDQDGNPVPGATLKFPDGQIDVDGSGAFTGDFLPGDYVVTIAKDGFVPRRAEFNVEAGARQSTTTFRLQRAIIRWTLRVEDEYGNPVPGASVKFPNGQTKVDGSGALNVDLATGSYVVTIEKDGFVALRELEFDVEASGRNTTVFRLQRASIRWTLRVVDQDGNPVPGASIKFPDAQIDVDGSGAFTGDFLPGDYVVTIAKDGFVPRRAEFNVQAGASAGSSTSLRLQREPRAAPPVVEPPRPVPDPPPRVVDPPRPVADPPPRVIDPPPPVDVSTSATRSLRVTVFDGEGGAIRNLEVITDPDLQAVRASGEAAPFRFRLKPGQFDVVVQSHGLTFDRKTVTIGPADAEVRMEPRARALTLDEQLSHLVAGIKGVDDGAGLSEGDFSTPLGWQFFKLLAGRTDDGPMSRQILRDIVEKRDAQDSLAARRTLTISRVIQSD